MTTTTTENVALPVALQEGLNLLRLEQTMANAKAQMTEAKAEYISLLPFATAEQFAVVLECARTETEAPEGADRLHVDFRLSEEQKRELAEVRQARKDWCAANKRGIMLPLCRQAEQRLVSVKVRVGPKKTVTSLRLEKTMGIVKKKGGLLARIRETLG